MHYRPTPPTQLIQLVYFITLTGFEYLLKICFTFALILGGIFSYAQSEFLSETNQQKTYYDSIVAVLGPDSMQGTGYTQYQRRYRYWAPKLNSNFDYADYQSDLLDYTNSYKQIENLNTEPTWHLIGPNDVPATGTGAEGTGQIHYIYKDPHDITGKTVFACSPVGGLFRSTNDGTTWVNAGTDKGLPRSGVSSILIDSKSSSTWYVSTGNGEGFSGEKAWQTAIGVWRTNDNGKNWKNIGLDKDDQGSPIYHMRKIIEIPNNTDSTHLIVTTTAGLYHSRNANSETPTWDTLKRGQFYDVVQDVNNPDIIFASGSNRTGIFKYNLGTNAYSKIFDIDTITFPYDTMVLTRPELRRISLKIPQVNSNFLFAVVSMRAYNYTAIYRYDISNNIWHKFFTQANFNGYGRKLGWAIRPDSIGKLQILGRDVEQLFRFSNGLSNDSSVLLKRIEFENDIPHHDTHFLWVEDNNQIIWAGTDGGVYKGRFVNDSTIFWESKNYGMGVATVEYIDAYSDQFNIDEFVTSGQFDCGSNTYRSENGIDWNIQEKSAGDGYQNIILTDNWYYLSSQVGRVLKFNQSNQSALSMGTYTSCDTTNTTLQMYGNWDTYYVNINDTLYAAGTKEVLKYYNSAWHEWSDFEQQIGCAKSGTWKVAAKRKSNGVHQIYASARQDPTGFHYLYKSINGGGHDINKWVKIDSTPLSGSISSIAITNNTDSVLVSIGSKIYSVNTLDPAHPVWYNITNGLDAGSINSIYREYNYATWLATERGVYYKINGTNSWIDYTNNLPNCEAKDIRVTSNKKVYVGTYGRGVWYASTPRCGNVEGTHYTAPGESIGLAFTRNYYGNIVVPTGNTYTIYGTLKMAADCKIIVEPGAKLIVDGGTITNACPDLWDGIEVWGNSNAVQDTINQGWVILKNQATLQYAKKGITVGKSGYSIVDLNFTGGVIQAEDAHFKNNTSSIAILPYPHVEYRFAIVDNKSYFKNCTFTFDSTYYFFDDTPRSHVQLTEVLGVLFEGNLFENNVSPSFAAGNKRGVGIAASQSGFKVVGAAMSEKRNTFNNLYYGITTRDIFLNNKPIIIDRADFNKNRTGCYMGASTFVSVTNCVFNARIFYEGLPGDLYSGLYLDNCTGYQVEENTFSSNYNSGLPYGYTSVGLVVNNSGPEDNLVYKNTFTKLLFATVAQNHNRSYNTLGKGLQYKCNVFENNYQDISVTWDGQPSELNGIALNQGNKTNEITAPAGNLFSQQGTLSFSDFDNRGEDVWYHMPYWGLSSDFKIKPVFVDTAKVHLNYNNYLTNWRPDLGCPSNLGGKTKSELLSLIADNELNSAIYSDSLSTMVDQGNTTALTLDVATSLPPETMQLRDQLLAASPYLSDTVMVSAAEKEDVLPNSIITEVLTANPQSVRAENVLNSLDARINPPSKSEMASLYANDTIMGAKEILESKQAFYTSNMVDAVNGLIRKYMSDSMLVDINDSIETVLSIINSPDSYYKRAFCNYYSGDSAGVLNMLAQIPYSFELSTYQTDLHSGYEDYFELLLELSSQGKRPTEVDSTQKTLLYSIMQNTNEILQAYCRNMLIATDGLVYNEPYIFPDTASTKSLHVKDHDDTFVSESSDFLRLYPNPAKEYITVEYQLPYSFKDGIIEIFNANGLNIEVMKLDKNWGQKIIDLRTYKSGSFTIRLRNGGKTLQSIKFIKY
ncbi:MAG: T9SS type A sorting domain-containing protein [Bacteroidales bacterium]|nr:T9SS type A sorting domain-containing protein [Bacteroidales bacterium]